MQCLFSVIKFCETKVNYGFKYTEVNKGRQKRWGKQTQLKPIMVDKTKNVIKIERSKTKYNTQNKTQHV